MELSPTPTGKIMDEALHRVAKVGSYIRSIEPYLLDANPIYDVGVFQPDFLCGGTLGYHYPTWRVDIRFKRKGPTLCLHLSPAELSTYPVVILDDSIPLDETIIKRIAGYVAEGGNLIVERGSDLGIPGQENLLCQVLGIHFHGKTTGAAHYLSGLASPLSVGMGEDDLVVEETPSKFQRPPPKLSLISAMK